MRKLLVSGGDLALSLPADVEKTVSDTCLSSVYVVSFKNTHL
jgi:hypothetical protein